MTHGIEVHGLYQAPVGLVHLGARGDGRARGGHAAGHRVAQRLQLAEAQHANAAGRRWHAHVGCVAGLGVDQCHGEVTLQPGDLPAQRTPGGAPAVLARASRGAQHRRGGGAAFEQLHGHPPIGARGLAPQKTWVPSIPMRCTSTMFTTIDLAVAVPTPTGPPPAL